MYTGIYFFIEAISYSILLIFVYFRKKVFKSKENKVYSALIIVTFIELLLEIILDFVGPLYLEMPKVSYSVAKIYGAFISFLMSEDFFIIRPPPKLSGQKARQTHR